MTLALRVGALLFAATVLSANAAHAQVRTDSARTDTTRRPSAPVLDSATQRKLQQRRDSIAAFRAADTIKSPFARFETPKSLEVDERFRFTRDDILASEATNLVDLLDRVPGIASFRSGWIASAHLASYLGDFARVRVFIDGIELDAIDPRSNGIPDFSDVHLWALDEIVVERAASELRVWCRTATLNHTTPYTRTDIFTGDLNTNGFRALFGRRFRDGIALQFSGQRFATQQGRVSAFGTTKTTGKGDGGNSTGIVRVGWAQRKYSVDAFVTITSRDRDQQQGRDSAPPIPAYKASRREAYLRLGYGDTTGGLWSQVILNSLRDQLNGIGSTASVVSDTQTIAPTDTVRYRQQNLFALGYSAANWQLSAVERLRTFNGRAWHSPALRATYSAGLLSGGLYAERQAVDSSKHIDGTIRVVPTSWSAVSLSHTVREFDSDADRKTETVSQLQGALRVHDAWLTGGFIQQGPARQKAPTLLVGNVTPLLSVKATGITFGARGPLYKDLRFDVQGLRWSDARVYRPQFSLRSDLGVQSNWLSRFPKGEFGINVHVIHELRDPVTFLYENPDPTKAPILIASERTQVFTTLLEIRIQHAVLFYHFHNMSGQQYEYVPGILMPRQVQFYGVRWDFWN